MNNTVNKQILDKRSCEQLDKKFRFTPDPVFMTSGISAFNINDFDLTGHSIPAECTSSGYAELNEPNRYWSNDAGGTKYCDFYAITSNQWYRFTGDAGTMMANYCIPKSSCNSDMAGWISGGSHPTVADGAITRTACMHWFSSCCYYAYTVEIRNCSGFYVYKLQQPGSCYIRYCGVKGKLTIGLNLHLDCLLVDIVNFTFQHDSMIETTTTISTDVQRAKQWN